ncbi:TonB system transport protein ExbD [Helicobacter winghamensis]|uniref:Biopolymer transport protein ExbD n=1 Tax=Helicobacter winghamensis TaxID=157268 RepID=A0A2N3PLA0_9HELI|nr:TonB system transport protein ExbD [Helicobacter winghamensis]EEO26724.1 TonB system transport protein ExbD [Helicobacter winghamensis ATCC BAA-430]PKT79534.1 TonB system transport protein ExbD [Helicobacter winghamensis]PKT79652.1 TonB system transport protein ExbD [Helicobacter winghamensis]PKT79705.1 TonB system transport protein ExbD [Helicobacter winghamensis]PKT82503.1 TonB system transport protein ExbD [Helicobacter winghamensis]
MIKAQKTEGLNIIPFIDIILVLLAMVLSISTFIAHGEIKLELPKVESSTQSNSDKDKIQIAINAENVFFLNGKESNLEAIQTKINSTDSTTPIELKSDKNAKFDSFVQIIDILRKNNHKNFQILTEKTP